MLLSSSSVELILRFQGSLRISTYSIGNSEKDKGPKLNFLVPINSAITVSTKASAWIRQSAICSFIFNPPFFAFSLCMFHSFRNRATCQHFLCKKPSLFSTNICPQRRNNLKLILSDFHKKSSIFCSNIRKKEPGSLSSVRTLFSL